MSNSFNVMAENPNVPSGSNGCLCHELGGHDTAGPFVVFIGTETDNILAPYPVLCAGCACKAAQLIPQPDGEKSLPDVHQERAQHNRKAAELVAPVRPVKRARAAADADGPSI